MSTFNKQLELEYEQSEDRKEIGRHHADFAKISLHAAVAESVFNRLHIDTLHNSSEDIMELQAAIRSIRNIVG